MQCSNFRMTKGEGFKGEKTKVTPFKLSESRSQKGPALIFVEVNMAPGK